MTEDRSLDEFFETTKSDDSNPTADCDDSKSTTDDSPDPSRENPDTTTDDDPESTVESDDSVSTSELEPQPTQSTSAWTSDGAACEQCGEMVTRRWRDGDVFVCADCKTWSQSGRDDDL